MNTQKNSTDLSITEYEISGPGVKDAVQESVKTGTNVCFVSDKDNLGNLLRVGYFLASRDANEQLTPIKWFDKNNINFIMKNPSLEQ